MVRAFDAGAAKCEAWQDPKTVAAGLRVPNPLGGALMLKALKESRGGAVAVPDQALTESQRQLSILEGVDACPEGGAAVAAAAQLARSGRLVRDERVVVFNTGAGVLYGRS